MSWKRKELITWTRKELKWAGWKYLGYVWSNKEIWVKEGKLILIEKRTRKVIAGEI